MERFSEGGSPIRKREDELIKPAEAAKILGVSARSLQRYAAAGLIASQETLGGHRRYKRSVVEKAARKVRAF